MIFLKSSLAFAFDEATQLPSLTRTNADTRILTQEKIVYHLSLIFADYKIEVRPFMGKGHGDEFK